MVEKEAEARPLMGTIFLVSFSYFQTLVLVSRARPFTDSSAMSR